MKNQSCPECGTPVGKPHRDNCEMERCSVCGFQRLSCDCEGHNSAMAAWTGEWPSPPTHRAIHVKVGTREGDIDAKIAPLIRELWKADVDTVLSCQNNPAGWVWICFDGCDSCERFLNILAEYDPHPESLYNHIRGENGFTPNELLWHFEIDFTDLAVEEDEHGDERPVGPPMLHPEISVRFPHSDLPDVLRRMRLFNNRNSRTRRRQVLGESATEA